MPCRPRTRSETMPLMELSGPLRIAQVPTPVTGLLGITHCPGRNGVDSAGCRWKRNLRDDLRDLTAWGAGAVLTLIEDHEFARLGVPEFVTEIRRTRPALVSHGHPGHGDAGEDIRRGVGSRRRPDLRIASRRGAGPRPLRRGSRAQRDDRGKAPERPRGIREPRRRRGAAGTAGGRGNRRSTGLRVARAIAGCERSRAPSDMTRPGAAAGGATLRARWAP